MTSHRRHIHAWKDLFLLPLLILALAGWLPGCSSGGDGSNTAQAATSETEEEGEDKEKKDEDGDKKEEDEDEEEKEKERPVPVEVTALDRGDIEAVLRSTTNLETERQVMVYSQAARLVRELLVEEGDQVERDEVLLRLQDDEQRSALAKVQSQYDKTLREYERQQRLFENELISEEQFNNATFDLEQLRISLDDAERELSYTEVRAPIRGTITGRHVNVGDQVTVGQHLFDLVDFDSMVARIYVPEKELARLRRGQKARIGTQSSADGSYGGEVIRISPIVDPQTGTVKVTVGLDANQGLRPGMYVDVELVTETHENALLIPKRSLVYDKDQLFVYRLGDERRVERIPVEPLLEDKEHVEPTAGLSEGDQVVIAGQAGLKDQALVRLPGDPVEEEEDEEPDAEDEEADAGDGESR